MNCFFWTIFLWLLDVVHNCHNSHGMICTCHVMMCTCHVMICTYQVINDSLKTSCVLKQRMCRTKYSWHRDRNWIVAMGYTKDTDTLLQAILQRSDVKHLHPPPPLRPDVKHPHPPPPLRPPLQFHFWGACESPRPPPLSLGGCPVPCVQSQWSWHQHRRQGWLWVACGATLPSVHRPVGRVKKKEKRKDNIMVHTQLLRAMILIGLTDCWRHIEVNSMIHC